MKMMVEEWLHFQLGILRYETVNVPDNLNFIEVCQSSTQ